MEVRGLSHLGGVDVSSGRGEIISGGMIGVLTSTPSSLVETAATSSDIVFEENVSFEKDQLGTL